MTTPTKWDLAQLYQLRGRVGQVASPSLRGFDVSKAQILINYRRAAIGRPPRVLRLGVGLQNRHARFRTARNAGNLLGAEQSGTVSAVGFDLYTQLLEQAVREFKHEEPDKSQIPLPTVDIPVAASIPDTYVPGEAPRILMYKKLAAVRDLKGVEQLQAEFEDRFGSPPPPVWNALALLRLRLKCQEIGINAITSEAKKISIVFVKEVKLPVHTLKPLNAAFKAQNHTFTQERVVLTAPSATKILPMVEEMVEVLAKALNEKAPPRVSPSANPSATRRALTGTSTGRR